MLFFLLCAKALEYAFYSRSSIDSLIHDVTSHTLCKTCKAFSLENTDFFVLLWCVLVFILENTFINLLVVFLCIFPVSNGVVNAVTFYVTLKSTKVAYSRCLCTA